jgi:hypothetical protein
LLFISGLAVRSQIIDIYDSFTSDNELQPFQPEYNKIYGISISGSVHLDSDTSLVRVILTDQQGQEWMVYEAYPLIVSDTAFDIKDGCDETCYLEETMPISLSIQIIDAELYITTLNLITEPRENLSILQYQAKRNKDLDKVQQMNENIQARGWYWTAADNELVAKIYSDKRIIFSSDKYNLQGFDYYTNGVFKCITNHENASEPNSTLRKSFDWRYKHDAATPGSRYYNGEDGWITPFQSQGSCGSCWAFSTVNSVEAVFNLYYNDTLNYDLSQQFIICQYDSGCYGGTTLNALLCFKNIGVIDEACQKYRKYDQTSPM